MKRIIKIRGKNVTFSSRALKSGKIAYYRSGKRTSTPYQKRIAKGVLSGQTIAQASGKSARDYNEHFKKKAFSPNQIQTEREGAQTEGGAQVDLWRWGGSISEAEKSRAYTWYVDVSVTNESMSAIGSPDGGEPTEDACRRVTLQMVLLQNGRYKQKFSEKDIRLGFRTILLSTLEKYHLVLCTNSPTQDVLAFWRHSER